MAIVAPGPDGTVAFQPEVVPRAERYRANAPQDAQHVARVAHLKRRELRTVDIRAPAPDAATEAAVEAEASQVARRGRGEVGQGRLDGGQPVGRRPVAELP